MNSLVVKILACSTFIALNSPAQTGTCGRLMGTWRLVSASQDGEARQDVAKTQTQIKHVTDTHFTWIIYKNDTKEVIAALGGPCSISGKSYTETPQYGFGIGESFAGLRDKEQRFTWQVEGDRWNLKGRITLGPKLEEVWERVKQ